MCTVTVIPYRAGYRLVHSRDEQHARAPAHPPRPISTDPAAWAPIDPEGGGTWVATREDGLTVAVMNRNPTPRPTAPPAPISRGLIVTEAIAHADSDGRAADHLIRDKGPEHFRPFTLLAVGFENAAPVLRWWAWDGQTLSTNGPDPLTPSCWVSSGLGDEIVAARLPLFDETVRPKANTETQNAYHRHAWPDRGPESVLMDRQDARTVSITTIEVPTPLLAAGRSGSDTPPSMTYEAVGRCGEIAAPESLVLAS